MNLLQVQDTSIVSKTSLSRKLTLGGITKAYPVFRVRLDQLFYNEQNDRIATWITQYQNDVNNISFAKLDRDEYNKIIERFIIESNPTAIEKTKNNIALVNQREPGVILADGRIIDGNRRFTCLRLIHEEDPTVNYFETVILDADVKTDQKQIKMLELAIQHGEEQRVDYNLIDLTIGAYHDISETKLLTIEEYASSTNETIAEVKKRLLVGQLITEFLDYMGVPKQYHIAREMQVYSLFYELVPLLKRCETVEKKEEVKISVFNNAMMGSFADQKKYIRSVKSMLDSGLFTSYLKKQAKINEDLKEKKEKAGISNAGDIETFRRDNEDITEDLQISLDRSVLQSKKAQVKSKPSQIVTKSLSMLMDVDTRVIDKLNDEEKEKLHTQLSKLSTAIDMIEEEVTDQSPTTHSEEKSSTESSATVPVFEQKRLFLAAQHMDEMFVYCCDNKLSISNLVFSLDFSAKKYNYLQSESLDYLVYFVDGDYQELCPVQEIHLNEGAITKVNFSLKSSASSLKECYLVLKSKKDKIDEAQQIVKFDMNISFSLEFDF